MKIEIKKFDERLHLYAVRECLIELQDFEREFDSRMPTGAEIAKAYVTQMRKRCTTANGQIWVAEVGDDVAGYVTVLSKVQTEEMHDGDFEYALIADLIVKSMFRGNGVGRALMQRAEEFAEEKGARWLRVGVLAVNEPALNLYASLDFKRAYVELEKPLNSVQHRRTT